MLAMTRRELAAMIDHTILHAEATWDDVRDVCSDAAEFGCAAVGVNGSFVPLACRELGSAIPVCAVVGFPLGAMASQAKADEAALAVEDGAREIDMVMNIGLLKDGDALSLSEEMEAV